MKYSLDLKDAKNSFDKNGYFLLKEGFVRDIVIEAAEWLKSQNLDQLAKTWTDQEPGVALAVYQNIHKDNSQFQKLLRTMKCQNCILSYE